MKLSPTATRGWLYFGIAVLTAVCAKIVDVLIGGQWPPLTMIVGVALSGTLQGLIAVRAYIDGSAERYKQEAETDTVTVAKVTETVKTETTAPPLPPNASIKE